MAMDWLYSFSKGALFSKIHWTQMAKDKSFIMYRALRITHGWIGWSLDSDGKIDLIQFYHWFFV